MEEEVTSLSHHHWPVSLISASISASAFREQFGLDI